MWCGRKVEGPIDVNTGKPLQNWQNLSFTPEQIMGMNGVVKSVGVRTGPDADNLLILDIDGDTAWEFCQQYNCSKRPGTGWKIWRSNATDRFKVAFQHLFKTPYFEIVPKNPRDMLYRVYSNHCNSVSNIANN